MNIKPGKFSGEGSKSKETLKTPKRTLTDLDSYNYRNSILRGLVVLSNVEDPYIEFTMALQLLLEEE